MRTPSDMAQKAYGEATRPRASCAGRTRAQKKLQKWPRTTRPRSANCWTAATCNVTFERESWGVHHRQQPAAQLIHCKLNIRQRRQVKLDRASVTDFLPAKRAASW